MNADNHQNHDTNTLSQGKIQNINSNIQALDNEQLDQITGGSIKSIVQKAIKFPHKIIEAVLSPKKIRKTDTPIVGRIIGEKDTPVIGRTIGVKNTNQPE